MLNPKILKINFHSESDPSYWEVMNLFIVVSESVSDKAQFNWSRDLIKSEMFQSKFIVLRGDDSSVVAFIAFREGIDQIEIMALGVLPVMKQSGLMSQLMSHLLDYSRKWNTSGCEVSKSVVLEVHAANDRAIRLYRRCGLFEVGRRRKYYSDGADALIFSSVKL